MASSNVRRSKRHQAFWTETFHQIVLSDKIINCDSPGSPWRPEHEAGYRVPHVTFCTNDTKSSSSRTPSPSLVWNHDRMLDSHHTTLTSIHDDLRFSIVVLGIQYFVWYACFNQFLRSSLVSTATVPTNTGWPLATRANSSTTALNFASG